MSAYVRVACACWGEPFEALVSRRRKAKGRAYYPSRCAVCRSGCPSAGPLSRPGSVCRRRNAVA